MTKKEKENKSFYNRKIEKEKLSLMKYEQRIQNMPKAEREIHSAVLKQDKESIGHREKILKQKEKIYEKSFRGRAEKGVNKLLEKGYKALQKKVVSRRILKPSQTIVTIKEYQVPSILNDPNRFFKSEMEETKKSLFFS